MVMANIVSAPKPGDSHLAKLRKAAGLSQKELADIVGTIQGNISFWETNDRIPRSDLLPKLADALNVTVDVLLQRKAPPKRKKGGPVGKVKLLFEEVSKLPRRQQEKVVEFVSAFVEQNKSSV